jgi:predicted transcriptional regulator of viral defense system
MLSIEENILNKIKKDKKATIFFAENFIDLGKPDAIRKALERLVKNEYLDRIAVGIYALPSYNEIIGKVSPSVEDVVKAIAKRDKARILPTGEYALNRLGLSTQMPMNIVYLTDGAARKIRIYNNNIKFKKASPKNLSAIGDISGLAIQALRAIGKNNITDIEVKKIKTLLKIEKKEKLIHDIQMAPSWIREIMKAVLN